MKERARQLLSLLFLTHLIVACDSGQTFSDSSTKPERPFGDSITREMASSDPFLLALVLASQEGSPEVSSHVTNGVKAITLQQVGVGWAAQGRKSEARWAFLKAIDYARKTRKQSNGRLRGLADSCIEAGCLDEALEASRYLRIEERSKIVGEVACKMLESGEGARAAELVDEMLHRLEDNRQAGGSTKNRAFLSLALALHRLGKTQEAALALEEGGKIDPEWPPIAQIRSHLENGETYLAMDLKTKALIHAKAALQLSRKTRDETMLVLTAELLHKLGDDEAASSIVSAGLFKRQPEHLAQAFARLGQEKKSLQILSECGAEKRAKGLYLSCDYFSTDDEQKEVLRLLDTLDVKHKDWQLLKSVGGLCAKNEDISRAERLFSQSLEAYQRDWPDIWADDHQRAFVMANFGRDLAQAKVKESSGGHHRLLKAAEESLTWPQSIKI